jgi:hypothetical protein
MACKLKQRFPFPPPAFDLHCQACQSSWPESCKGLLSFQPFDTCTAICHLANSTVQFWQMLLLGFQTCADDQGNSILSNFEFAG